MSDLDALREAIAQSDNTIPYEQFRDEMDDELADPDESPAERSIRQRIDAMERNLIDIYRRLHLVESRHDSLWQALSERGQGNP